ncbi:MAG TPA: PCRF domain-containing protein, partial [Candidatus Dormibacteraeota bacterium]|nr:PCRF domain-containing protein [Candidatus Dormibacteraeota bacterium]
MDSKEQQLRSELKELDEKLEDPAVYSDKNYPKLAKRKSELEETIALFDEKSKLNKAKVSAQQLRDSENAELQRMAATELEELRPKIAANETALQEILTPQDPNDSRDVIIE